jgi:hypothetical protein
MKQPFDLRIMCHFCDRLEGISSRKVTFRQLICPGRDIYSQFRKFLCQSLVTLSLRPRRIDVVTLLHIPMVSYGLMVRRLFIREYKISEKGATERKTVETIGLAPPITKSVQKYDART